MKQIDYEELLEYLPEKYKYTAIDKDGDVYVYTDKPIKRKNLWGYGVSKEHLNISMNIKNKPDWKKSLRKRPQKVKPCPLCGEKEFLFILTDFDNYYHIQCYECFLKTDLWEEKKDLIDYWNTRADTNVSLFDENICGEKNGYRNNQQYS